MLITYKNLLEMIFPISSFMNSVKNRKDRSFINKECNMKAQGNRKSVMSDNYSISFTRRKKIKTNN